MKKILLLAIVLIIIAISLFLLKLQAPQEADKHEAKQTDILKNLAIPSNSFIVFDSKRKDNFGIYRYDFSTSEIKKVIDTEKHELYPDVSPDGKMLLFASHDNLDQKAVGQIFLSTIDGKNLEKIADDSTFPTFSSDGTFIIYEYKRHYVMKYKIKSKKHTVLFPRKKYRGGFNTIAKPRLSNSRRWLTFTSDRPDRWTSWYVDLKEKIAYHGPSGCEILMSSDDSKLYWVKPGTKGSLAGSGIYFYDLKNKTSGALQDEPGPWGHEYFPSTAGNDKWLIYSACPENQHSAIDSNYQLYIKNLETGKSQKVFEDNFNNRWPKLVIGK